MELLLRSPGQSQVLSTNFSGSLSPQVLYDMTPSPSSEIDVSLVQGYSEWNGSGPPPASAAHAVRVREHEVPASSSTTFPRRPRHPRRRRHPRRPRPRADSDAHTRADAHADTGSQSRRSDE